MARLSESRACREVVEAGKEGCAVEGDWTRACCRARSDSKFWRSVVLHLVS